MAEVKAEQRCNGPLVWQTVDRERRLMPKGLCGTEVKVSYDDSDTLVREMSELLLKTGLKCDRCSEEGKKMFNRNEALVQRLINERHKGKKYSSGGGKEHTF